MSIQMIGIDHTKAAIDVRTIFSFTQKNIAAAMETWKQMPQIQGCVMIATCNRVELWASVHEDAEIDLFALLCREKNADAAQYRSYVTAREGREAAAHLFELACGLHSRIIGEDQIITQVKDALAFAREQYATDSVLEVLFRMAVTAAKRVKSEVLLSGKDQSVIHHAVEVLKERGYTFADKTCMVIGNGEMGRLSATLLAQEGADVTVTVRQYRNGMVQIPQDCRRIDYGARMEFLPRCDYVVSATRSPNYTLREEQILASSYRRPLVLIDLAVPRDIEPSAGRLPGVTLFDVDSFDSGQPCVQTQQDIAAAKEILARQMNEFFDWYEGRDVIEKVQRIREAAMEDFHLRTQKQTKELMQLFELTPEQSAKELAQFQNYIETAAGKVVNKMMFGLRGKVSEQTFRECMEALGNLYG